MFDRHLRTGGEDAGFPLEESGADLLGDRVDQHVVERLLDERSKSRAERALERALPDARCEEHGDVLVDLRRAAGGREAPRCGIHPERLGEPRDRVDRSPAHCSAPTPCCDAITFGLTATFTSRTSAALT